MREQTITVPTAGATAGFTAVQSYGYDSLNRLQSASETVSGGQTWRQTFNYDRYGNRTFDAAGTTTLVQSNNVTNPVVNPLDNRFSAGQGYNYDLAGNVSMNATGMQFVYDAENHQTEARDGGGFVVGQYFYDGEGKRVKKVSNTETTVFVYDGGGVLVAEYSTAGNPTAAVKYLTQDHLGSPRIITDQNGAVVSRTDFGAFGDETITPQRTAGLGYSAADGVRQDYTGYQKDDESGLEFAQARYYNPAHGRFTSVDPLTASASIRNPQTFNRYSYVLNSPYKFVDPLGLISSSTGACGQCGKEEFGGGGGGVNPVGAGTYIFVGRQDAEAPAPPPPPRPPTADEQQAINRLNQLIAAETTIITIPIIGTEIYRSVSDLGQALTMARDEIVSTIASLGPGETNVGLQTTVNAINAIGDQSYANSSVKEGPGGPYPKDSNKCNVFCGIGTSTASGVPAGSSKGYPLTDGVLPAANYLGDSRDSQKLKNLPVVRDGSLRIGDIIAYRHKNASAQNSGHSAIYIGGGAVVYAGADRVGGVPIANTLKALDSGMFRDHFPRTVRRFTGGR